MLKFGFGKVLLSAFFLSFLPSPLETVRKVTYDPNVVNFLAHDYVGQTREVPLCMIGKERSGSFEVTDLRFPHIHWNYRDSSRYDPCNVHGYLGMVHNHVTNICSMSKKDGETFYEDKDAKLETIVCGVNGEKVRMATFYKSQ